MHKCHTTKPVLVDMSVSYPSSCRHSQSQKEAAFQTENLSDDIQTQYATYSVYLHVESVNECCPNVKVPFLLILVPKVTRANFLLDPSCCQN